MLLRLICLYLLGAICISTENELFRYEWKHLNKVSASLQDLLPHHLMNEDHVMEIAENLESGQFM